MKKRSPRLVFLAAPGAGKSTQARRVAESLRVPHIAMGDILREEVAAGTELGRRAAPHMDAGELVPDDIIVRMLAGRIGKGGFVLDGFPRDRAQAELLEERIDGVDGVIVLDVPEEEVVRRLSGRRECPQGHVYQLEDNPPAEPGRCDVDGEPLSQRDDDRPGVIKNRLRVYEEETRPLIEFYAARGVVEQVDGTGNADAVTERILDRLRAPGPPSIT